MKGNSAREWETGKGKKIVNDGWGKGGTDKRRFRRF